MYNMFYSFKCTRAASGWKLCDAQSNQLHHDADDVILLYVDSYGKWFALLRGDVRPENASLGLALPP